MTYEAKNITISCCMCDCWCSRTLLLNVAIESAHNECEIFVQGLGLVEDVWKAKSDVIKGGALYKSMILGLSDLFTQSV